MDLLKTRLSDFKPIQLSNKGSFDDTRYQELKVLLQRLSKSEQKSAQIVELLKDEVGKTLSDSREITEEVRREKTSVSMENKVYKKALIEYCDIIDNMEKNAKEIDDRAFQDAATGAASKKNEICQKIGMQEVPGEGSKTDPEVHYVRDKEATDNLGHIGIIKGVIRKGYRIGSEVLRKADVIVYTKK